MSARGWGMKRVELYGRVRYAEPADYRYRRATDVKPPHQRCHRPSPRFYTWGNRGVIGAVAGWLAGKIVEGAGFGLIVDIIVGVVGAFGAGNWLCSTTSFAGAATTAQTML